MTARADSTESTEGRLIASALRHIRRDGFRRATIVRIAESAGMTHANVYRYFASKEALGERIVGDWLRGIEQRLNDVVQSPDPASDKLERFLMLLARAYEEKAVSDPEVFTIFADAAESDAVPAERHRRRTRDLLRHVLEEAMASRIIAGDTRRAERLILDAMHRFLDPHSVRRSIRRKDGRAAAMDTRRDRMVRLLLRGISQGRA